MRINATDLQNAFGKYLALTEKEDIIITKNGRSVAKLTRYNEPDYFLIHEEALKYKTTRKISYEEYMELVESSDQRYELIDGEVYLLASPAFDHQVVLNEIAGYFYNYFKGKPCRSLTAPLDVRLFGYATKFEEDPNVVQPDIVVVCDEDKVNADNRYEGIPSLVVEVLSPSTKGKDMVTKLNLYMKSGVREYWIVDLAERSITHYAFSGERDIERLIILREDDIVRSPLFPGLEIRLPDLFEEIRPKTPKD
ncbi:type II toxin-antitoxin system prevent-host-death family antitoxin [Desulfitobacterium chlororespirans]|uniref:Prevent-host-death family protein n=1 Tax=Desulfitobacterium chlororespirans DSM 11544 TaxID=1121395 RepID=A0A1M7SHF4_9FIRM|nr:type II toxin-antitoxin system prevent-host-death family antitoxin [Desulfitobacterium chlororespirans]SHN57908.1 prevent-host-death family protein [Desulfitobacterium chlororespirans DSM 11544]